MKLKFKGVVGISGYLFEITNFDLKLATPYLIIHGAKD